MLLLVQRNVNILLRLVNQILDFRKYENGKMEYTIQFIIVHIDAWLVVCLYASSDVERKSIEYNGYVAISSAANNLDLLSANQHQFVFLQYSNLQQSSCFGSMFQFYQSR